MPVSTGAVAFLVVGPDELQALLLGLGTGSLVAALALGVVLTYRGSGVVSFAHGAVATYSAYSFNALRRDGSIFLPFVPSGYGFGHPLPMAQALAVAIALAVLVGFAFHFMVFRWLRAAPLLTKAIASVGLLLVLQALVVLRFGGTTRPVLPVLASTGIHLPGGVTVPGDQLLLTGGVIATAAALSAFFRWTRIGLATRAAADNDRGAALLGFSPDLLAGANWVLSTVLVSGLGILVATVNGSIDPGTITLLIVPALGAALVGGFASFSVTVAAAFAIAMVQNLIELLTTYSWYPQTSQGPFPGVPEALPLVVIVGALLVRGKSLPLRGETGLTRLPAVPRPRPFAAHAFITTAACLVGLMVLGPTWRLAITNSLIGVLICLSLVVLTGFVGQISLAQMAIAGIAGFTLSKLASGYGVPFPIAPLVGATVAMAVGVLLALPAIRIRGVHLAVVTLAAGVSIESMVFAHPRLSGGFNGADVGPPRIFGVRFGPNDLSALSVFGYRGDGKLPNPWFGVFCLIIVLSVGLLVVKLRRSAAGRRLLAVRGNERAAAAVGVNVVGTKLFAAGAAAFIAGLAGALSGYRSGSVTATAFGGLASLIYLSFAYLGGITSVSGAVIGGTLVSGGLQFTALKEWFGFSDDYNLLVAGLGLVLTAILNPEGVAGAVRKILDRLSPDRQQGRQVSVVAPESAAPTREVRFSDR